MPVSLPLCHHFAFPCLVGTTEISSHPLTAVSHLGSTLSFMHEKARVQQLAKKSEKAVQQLVGCFAWLVSRLLTPPKVEHDGVCRIDSTDDHRGSNDLYSTFETTSLRQSGFTVTIIAHELGVGTILFSSC